MTNMTQDELDILESNIGSAISTLTTTGTLVQQVKESKTQCCDDDSMFAHIDPEILDTPHIKDLENDPVTIAMRPFFTQKEYNKIIIDTHILEMTGVSNDETGTLIRSTINNIIKAADAIRNDQEDDLYDNSVEIREIANLRVSMMALKGSCNNQAIEIEALKYSCNNQEAEIDKYRSEIANLQHSLDISKRNCDLNEGEIERLNRQLENQQCTKQYDIIEKMLHAERNKTSLSERLNEQLRETINELRIAEFNHDRLTKPVKVFVGHSISK